MKKNLTKVNENENINASKIFTFKNAYYDKKTMKSKNLK